MAFSQGFIEKVRDASDIVDLIGSYTRLKPAGANLSGLCPFPDHKEKTPSFSVSPTKQVYYCFGCKKSGNVFTFVENMLGLSFPETIEYLAHRAAIAIPKDEQNKQTRNPDEKKQLTSINRFACEFFRETLSRLPKDHKARQYIARRGLSDGLVEQFQIGYAPEAWEGLTSALHKNNLPLKPAALLGLIKERGSGQGHFDVLRGRVIFPIHSQAGDVIGFGGRVLNDEHPKYLNSAESPVFQKGKIFYGLYETAKHLRAADEAIVVEGYMDFLALFQAGITNVVATLGTALTIDHAKLLSRFTKNIVVLFDGDRAGQEAAERSLPLLLAAGLLPRSLTLPDNLDPDDFVKTKGVNALKKQISQARDLFLEVLDRYMQGYTGADGQKVRLIDQLAPFLNTVSDNRLRELYLQEISDRLGVPMPWAEKALAGQKTAPSTVEVGAKSAEVLPKAPQSEDTATPKATEIIQVTNPPRAELELLNLALLAESYFQRIVDSGVVELFTHEGLKKIFNLAIFLYRQRGSKFANLAASLVDYVQPGRVISLHLEKPLADINPEGAHKLIEDCTKRIKDAHLRAEYRKLTTDLKGREATQQIQKLEQIMNIQRDRHSLKGDPEPK